MSELERRLAQPEDLIALQLQGKEAARLIGRDSLVPAGYIALCELPDKKMAIVPAGAELGKNQAGGVSLFRAGPIPLSFKAQPLRTAEGHEIACVVTLRVAVRPNVNDMNALIKQFVGRNKPNVEASDINGFLEEHVLVAARVFAHGKSTADLLAPASVTAIADHMAQSLERPLLSVGLSLVPGMLIHCLPITEAAISFFQPTASPAGQDVLHRALLSQFDDLAQRAGACGQAQVGEALRKLRAKVAGQAAFTTFEQVMQVLPERVRSEVYDALIKLFAADPAERLVATAGAVVVCWFLRALPDSDKVPEPAWKASLAPDLGGCRSVRLARDAQGKPVVLVGCQKGVAILDGDNGGMVAMLLEPYQGTSRAMQGQGSGFNAAVLRRRQCWASKSDVGMLCWELDRPGAPYAILGAGRTQAVRFVRAVTVDGDGTIWFGADNWLLRCAGGVPTAPDTQWFVPIDSPLTSVEVDGEDIWLGTQAGSLWRISRLDPRNSERVAASPGQAVEAATVRRTGLLRWLVYADGKTAIIRARGGAYMRSLAGGTGVRAARSAGGWIAGLNDWRDALLLWNCGSLGREPVRITIQKMANARIQDFDLG